MKIPFYRNLSPAFRIAGLYLLIGLLWILFSDMILTWWADDTEELRLLQTFKGWFFVLVTALLLFFLVQRSFHRLNLARNSLREAFRHYSHLFLNNPHPMWIFDCKTMRITEVNEAALKTYGYSKREFLELTVEQLYELTDSEDLTGVLDCNAPEYYQSSGFRHRKKDGSLIDVELITHRLPGEDHRPLRLVSALDITGRKQAFEALKASEQALLESERQLSTLLSNLPGMAYRCLNDQDFTMLFASKGCLELTGYPAEVLVENAVISYGRIIHPADRQRVWDEVQQKVFDKMPYPLTYRIVTANGKVKWVWEQAIGVFNEKGELKFVEGFISDITEPRNAEKALKNNNELLRSIIDHIAFPMFYKDLQGRVLGCNKAFCEYLGKPLDKIIGRTAWELIPYQKASEINQIDNQVLSELSVFHQEEELVYASGKAIDAVYQKSLFFDADGIPQGFIGLYFDITERTRAEKIIRKQMEDLERINAELEQFTYTVSHDLRSPLVTIKGSVNLLRDDIKAGDEDQIEQGLTRISAATQRMHHFLEDLLQLSRIGRIGNPFTRFPLNELLAEVKQSLHGILTESNAHLEIEPGLPEVLGDRTRISEVFQNLVENAVKFREPGRELVIKIGCREKQEPQVFFVQDNGMGIEPGQLTHIFGLFKKGDPSGQGTGIGLTLVKRIVEYHGGKVWAESAGVGQGTTICFSLGKMPVGEN